METANRSNIGAVLDGMIGDREARAVVTTIYKSEEGILKCMGLTVPTDGTLGYAPGCTFQHVDGEVIASGSVRSGTATTLVDLALASTYDRDDELIGLYVVDTDKLIYGAITDYNGTTGAITVADWLNYAGTAVANTKLPVDKDPYYIFGKTSPNVLYINVGNNIGGNGCKFERVLTAGMNEATIIDGLDAPSRLIWEDVDLDALRNFSGGFLYENDFMGPIDVTSADGWTITLVDAKGAMSVEADAPGGVVQFTSATGDSADDGINAQLQNCCVLPAAGQKIYFEARIKVSEADEQWAIGLAEGGMTALIASGIFDDTVCKVAFGHHTGTADKINTITADDAAQDETADVAAMTDDTWVKVGFVIDGITSVKFYVNGVLVETGSTAANIANEALVLTCVAQYEAADTILSVDWVRVAQVGIRDA